MGETSIDEDTFEEYLAEIKKHYTADKVSSNPFNIVHKTVFTFFTTSTTS